MIDLHTTIVNTLATIGLPVHYEMILHKGLSVPCISYMELTNFVTTQSDISDVSAISYQVKVWANKISDLQTYSLSVDTKMRALGFQRVGSAELQDNNSTMMQKILTYQCLRAE